MRRRGEGRLQSGDGFECLLCWRGRASCNATAAINLKALPSRCLQRGCVGAGRRYVTTQYLRVYSGWPKVFGFFEVPRISR
jgi:hypothetical protein